MEKPKYRAFKDSWSVNSFVKRFNKGEINFDNPIQRGVVWTRKDSSLYIHSLLYDILIYQKPFLISKKEKGWDILDGKQRGTTLIKFINNEFALSGLEKASPIIVDGEEVFLNRKKFKNLPEELQMKILDFQIEIAMLEDAPVAIEALFFERSNSGRAMTRIDLARSRNRSMDTIKAIGEHEIFKIMFPRALEKLPQDEIVVKTWQALNETDPDYSAKHFQSLMQDLIISDEDTQQILSVYDKVLAAYKIVLISHSDVANIMLKKTHFLSYISSVEDFENVGQLAKWLIQFYTDMPTDYHDASSQRTTGAKNTKARLESVRESVEKFLIKKTE